LSSAFLSKCQEHFETGGHDIWQIMHDKFPIEYFWGLITLAKVLKIETGAPGDFDRPATREEALDRLERTARGPRRGRCWSGFSIGLARLRPNTSRRLKIMRAKIETALLQLSDTRAFVGAIGIGRRAVCRHATCVRLTIRQRMRVMDEWPRHQTIL
jgi:hypothetical protein